MARDRGLVMKVVDVEMHAVAPPATVYFNAEERIDFRDLVRDLARELRSRRRDAPDRRARHHRSWTASGRAGGSSAAPRI
jgi:cell fate regulator YaaT (PSP1 superfamily)